MTNTRITALSALCLASAAWARPVETTGTLEAVTVYRGQALVTRVISVPGPSGLREIVVTGLPEAVLPGSVYAESANGIAVRSIRYRVRQVAADVRDEVREIDAEIAERRQAIEGYQRRRDVIAANRAYLQNLEAFTACTSNLEINNGILKADTLKDLTVFLFEHRERLSEEQLQLDRKQASLNEEIGLLQRQRGEVAGASARTAREAVIFVDVQNDTGGKLRVRYLVNNASWSPSYNVRAGEDRDQATIEYNASVQQRSGENWVNVEMTLSTATPALIGKAPKLTPLKVALTEIGQAGPGNYLARQSELLGRKKTLEGNRNNPILDQQFQQQARQRQQQQVAVQTDELWLSMNNSSNDFALNSISAELQVLDLMARPGDTRRGKGKRPNKEGVSVTYRLPGHTSLPSRSDRQSIQIAALDMPASFYKVAIPVLTNFIYDEAAVANNSEMVLLAGPSMAFAQGQFVGHGEIPTVAAGENFTVGFGIDASLRATRELLNKNERIQGGNRIVTFKYRLAVENFGSAEADIRVLDRLPKSRSSQVKITLTSPGAPLSEDRVYLGSESKEGILRWDSKIPAGVSGPDAFAIDYEFTLEYDHEKAITGLAHAG